VSEAANSASNSDRHPTTSPDLAVKVAADTIAAQLAAIRAAQNKAMDGEPEPIHRLRVATRRIRAALRLLREIGPSTEMEDAADELGWLSGIIGAVRDLDVLEIMVQDRATRLEAGFARALAPLSDAIRRQRAAEHDRLVASLNSERYRGLLQRLSAIVPEPNGESVPLGAVAGRLVRGQIRAILRAGAGLDEASPPEALHRLRIRAKKLRYALEPLTGIGRKPARRMLKRLERLQDGVGVYNDSVTAAAWLRGWANDANTLPPATLLATGALIYSFQRRLRRLHARSLKAWRRSDMERVARALLDELSRAAAEARRNSKSQASLLSTARAS
jgi:triphosphatase